jgi:hypothetical protein
MYFVVVKTYYTSFLLSRMHHFSIHCIFCCFIIFVGLTLFVLYGCETWSLTLREEHRLRVFENKVLRRIFGPKRDEVRNFIICTHPQMREACGTHGRGEKSVQGFGGKARRKETTWKTKA